MDFLNKAFTQLNDLFRSMTPGGRITTGLLLVVAVVSVGYLFQHEVSGGDNYLFDGDSIPTPTLQKMEAAFGKAGLNGFSIEGGRVKVPHAQRAAYLAALADAKALPPSLDRLGQTENEGLFWSKQQREDYEHHQKEENMSLVISSMKGIERATVTIDKQDKPGFDVAPIKTASVTVWAIGGALLDDDQVDKIRYYVTAANAGMKPENVTVTDANGTVHVGDKNGPGGDDTFMRAQRSAERDLNEKVRKALAYIPSLTVISAVTLDHDKGTHSLQVQNDPKPVPLHTSEDTVSSNKESASAGGPPGVQAQGGGANQAASVGGGKGTNETHEESKTDQVNVVSTTQTEKETFGGTPKLAKVSVGIPTSYFEKVWQGRNPVKEGEEPKKPDQAALDAIIQEVTSNVRNAVAPLLPPAPEVKEPSSLVTVTTFQDIKLPEIPGPAVTTKAMSWLGENWSILAMVGLVLFSLGVLRSLLRAAPNSAAESSVVSARVSATEPEKSEKSEEPVEATAARRLRRMTGSGPSLRDELSELVKEDPDSAANVLRAWIGQVS